MAKSIASLFPLMRDNKESNSTAYGGVQAGSCSKRPLHSLPYGVTNCWVFFPLRQGGTPKEKLKEGRGEEKNKLIWGESRMVLMLHFVVSLQIEPKGSTALFIATADLGIATKFSTACTPGGRVLGADVIRLSVKKQSDSEFNQRQNSCLEHLQQCFFLYH